MVAAGRSCYPSGPHRIPQSEVSVLEVLEGDVDFVVLQGKVFLIYSGSM